MKLTSLIVRNYRTLEDISITFSKNYCTISGKNNAGKSGIIRLLSALFQRRRRTPWVFDDIPFTYKEDKTQWNKDEDSIVIQYNLELNKDDDSALISFIEKIASKEINTDPVKLFIEYSINDIDEVAQKIRVNEIYVDDKATKEIDKKIKDSDLLFIYNSTKDDDYHIRRGKHIAVYDIKMSKDEKKTFYDASKSITRHLKKLAKEHKEALNNILGRLTEKYDVELSLPEGYATRYMPLGINLKDKNVDVPLIDWGSGTQNRTHILAYILQAYRIKTTVSPDEKITPIVMIEEPESFLHPSAQAEFGRILCELSTELGIQIIVTTHSPYMLNRENPKSNILLCRKITRKKAFETNIVDTTGDKWMAPFAEHLGIAPEEFNNWVPFFSTYKNKILLVEGDLDKEYFSHFQQQNGLPCTSLLPEIEIAPYGGKGTLKNNQLLKFVLSKFDKVFITYDLDAENEIKNTLTSLGLQQGKDFLALGMNVSGKKAIEGLLPDRVLSVVAGREIDLIRQLSESDTKIRNNARKELKKKYLEEFISTTPYTSDELRGFDKILIKINGKLK